jgi:hypothetical protein
VAYEAQSAEPRTFDRSESREENHETEELEGDFADERSFDEAEGPALSWREASQSAKFEEPITSSKLGDEDQAWQAPIHAQATAEQGRVQARDEALEEAQDQMARRATIPKDREEQTALAPGVSSSTVVNTCAR